MVSKKISLLLFLVACSKEVETSGEAVVCLPVKDTPSCFGKIIDEKSFSYVKSLDECPYDAPDEATTCSDRGNAARKNPAMGWKPDACGCDGKACPDGLTCVLETVEAGVACGPQYLNQCVPVCFSHKDCAEDEVCIPARAGHLKSNRCKKATCRSDEDCTERPCGRCVVDNVYVSHCLSNARMG